MPLLRASKTSIIFRESKPARLIKLSTKSEMTGICSIVAATVISCSFSITSFSIVVTIQSQFVLRFNAAQSLTLIRIDGEESVKTGHLEDLSYEGLQRDQLYILPSSAGLSFA